MKNENCRNRGLGFTQMVVDFLGMAQNNATVVIGLMNIAFQFTPNHHTTIRSHLKKPMLAFSSL
jgi:hypothetical protein